MKEMFAEWYCKQNEEALSHGKKVEDIETKFSLTVIQPLHTKWLIEFYNHITSEKVLKLSLMAGKDQEFMMQSKMAAAHYLPLSHFTK